MRYYELLNMKSMETVARPNVNNSQIIKLKKRAVA